MPQPKKQTTAEQNRQIHRIIDDIYAEIIEIGYEQQSSNKEGLTDLGDAINIITGKYFQRLGNDWLMKIHAAIRADLTERWKNEFGNGA